MCPVTLYAPRRKKISITALIDVVFILLMFFMLTSSFTKWNAIDFKSPVFGGVSTGSETQFLFLNTDNSISLRNSAFKLHHFNLFTNAHTQAFTQDSTVLIPEADVDVQSIINAIEQLKKAGLTRVTLGNSRPATVVQSI